MKEQTPMQELIELMTYKNGGYYYVGGYREGTDVTEEINKLLEKEKKMVIDAYSSGFVSGKWQTDGNDNIYHAKKYFNNKYNTNGN